MDSEAHEHAVVDASIALITATDVTAAVNVLMNALDAALSEAYAEGRADQLEEMKEKTT